MSAFITRRGGGIGGGSVVTGYGERDSRTEFSANGDLAGKTGFALVCYDYYSRSATDDTYLDVYAIYYLAGEYTIVTTCDGFVEEFSSWDGDDMLSFDSATGTITLNNEEYNIRFISGGQPYYYVGW